MMRVQHSVLLISGLLLALCAGCGADSDSASTDDVSKPTETSQGAKPEASAECVPFIRRKGITYRGYGYTAERPRPFSRAEVADCRDTQPDSPGSVFASTPPKEAVGTFRGFPAEEVLGVRFNETTYSVFIAQSLPRAKGEAILADLRGPRG